MYTIMHQMINYVGEKVALDARADDNNELKVNYVSAQKWHLLQYVFVEMKASYIK